MEVDLEFKKGKVNIVKYHIYHPFSVQTDRKGDVYWTLRSISTENIKGSFTLLYAHKIDFTEFAKDSTDDIVVGNETIIDGGGNYWVGTTSGNENVKYFGEQFINFRRHIFFHMDENNIDLNKQQVKKRVLPKQLIYAAENPHATIQFYIRYKDGSKVASNEKIKFYLELHLSNGKKKDE